MSSLYCFSDLQKNAFMYSFTEKNATLFLYKLYEDCSSYSWIYLN